MCNDIGTLMCFGVRQVMHRVSQRIRLCQLQCERRARRFGCDVCGRHDSNSSQGDGVGMNIYSTRASTNIGSHARDERGIGVISSVAGGEYEH